MNTEPKKVWKTEINLEDKQTIELPEPAKPLCVQVQYGKPCIWWEVNPKGKKIEIDIFVIGTGWANVPEKGTYIGTIQKENGRLVWHVYYEDKKGYR